MGKKASKRNQQLLAAAPIVAGIDSTDVETPRPPVGAFSSQLISVNIGNSSEYMTLHSGVLSQSTVLRNRIQETQYRGTNSLTISDVTTPIFDRILRYLYGSPFENCISTLPSRSQGEAQDQDVLRIAGEIHCFSLTYGLEELGNQIASFIQNTSDATYQSVLETAKHVYKHAPRIEPWFRDFVSQKTREALTDPEVADKTWFIETFEGGYNGLSKELFECYKHIHRISSRAVSTPVSEVTPLVIQGKRVDSDQACTAECTLQEATPAEEALEEVCSVCEVAPEEPEEPASEEEEAIEPLEETSLPAIASEPECAAESECAAEPECEPEAAEEPCPTSPLSPFEMIVRHDQMNSCPFRHIHLRKKYRWRKCHDCTQEMHGITRGPD